MFTYTTLPEATACPPSAGATAADELGFCPPKTRTNNTTTATSDTAESIKDSFFIFYLLKN
jgi:hypothetical protein